MISNKIGLIQNNLYKLGVPECPIYLLDGPEPVIVDAGISCGGKIYAEAIRSILGNRQPSLIFLTHVHWDHCGAVFYLKNQFPKMKVAASSLSVKILQRHNAVALIKKLNENMTTNIKSIPGINSTLLLEEPFSSFEVDVEIADNQELNLGEDTTIRVLATPGHTQDHTGYFIPQEKILFAGEAAGVYSGSGAISTEFMFSYDAYLASLRRMAFLDTEIFCQGHYHHFIGREEIRNFFDQSINETILFKDRVMELLAEEAGSIDKVVQRLKAEDYDVAPGPKQWETTYLINLEAKVAHLATDK
ncbi:MAG: MBL fold metallo-hydrolase [Methylocystaceae bacterium]